MLKTDCATAAIPENLKLEKSQRIGELEKRMQSQLNPILTTCIDRHGQLVILRLKNLKPLMYPELKDFL